MSARMAEDDNKDEDKKDGVIDKETRERNNKPEPK
jgi:hypothetical protein